MIAHIFRIIIFGGFLSGIITFSGFSMAEPWLSNRSAQNCAGCHSPGRFNLPAKDRRCTLTCQGCHVSAQGGGMKNQYGIWNQQRWLRSFVSSETLQSKKIPAPVSRQGYMIGRSQAHLPQGKAKLTESKKKGANKQAKNIAKAKAHKNKKHQSTKKRERAVLVLSEAIAPLLSDYDKHTYDEWEEAKTKAQFESAIPQEDPYRLEREKSIYASGNFRYLYGTIEGEGVPESLQELSFFMAADIGVRMRPIREKLSFVVETRYDNGPSNKDIEDGFTSHAFARSAYALVDDLPYNSFVMAGIFRPMFGNMTADHTALAQRASGFSQTSTFKAVSIGTSPNVPFLNVSFIQPMSNGTNDEEGIAVALGARFVTKSLSTKVSLWQTEGRDSKIKKSLYSYTAGAMFGRLILNGEFLQASQEITGKSFHEGHIYTFEAKYRMWRETYLTTSFANSNVSPVDLDRGSGKDIGVGVKIFGFPGTELEIAYIKKRENTSDIETDWTYTQVLAHIFF